MIKQFRLIAGLKRFGERGEQAATNELTQLHDMNTFIPMCPEKWSTEEISEALAILMFLV